MPSEAKKYLGFARECMRLAGQAKDTQTREKLIDLARVWMNAAMNEQELARSQVAAAH
jgi:hypothetical protein